MIRTVNDENILLWAMLATEIWHTNVSELVSRFQAGKHPYEFLYYLDNEVIGFISLSIRQDDVEGASTSPVAYVEGIVIKAKYRQSGFAKELIEFALLWAKENQLKELVSNVEYDNQMSQLVHEKLGFREASRTVNYIMKVN